MFQTTHIWIWLSDLMAHTKKTSEKHSLLVAYHNSQSIYEIFITAEKKRRRSLGRQTEWSRAKTMKPTNSKTHISPVRNRLFPLLRWIRKGSKSRRVTEERRWETNKLVPRTPTTSPKNDRSIPNTPIQADTNKPTVMNSNGGMFERDEKHFRMQWLSPATVHAIPFQPLGDKRESRMGNVIPLFHSLQKNERFYSSSLCLQTIRIMEMEVKRSSSRCQQS